MPGPWPNGVLEPLQVSPMAVAELESRGPSQKQKEVLEKKHCVEPQSALKENQNASRVEKNLLSKSKFHALENV